MKVKKSIIAALLVLAAAAPALGQSQSDMQMTAASRQQLVEKLSEEVDKRYVFPERAKQVAASLREQHKRGAYDGITSARRLTEVLTAQMQATSNDRHLRVTYSEEPILARVPQAAASPQEAANRLGRMRAMNFGVEKVERLPFNIGYLELAGFVSAADAAETLAAAMTLLAHTDALVIDLRNNLGGDATTSTFLASYLLDKRTHLGDFYYRAGNRIEQRWSMDVVPGLRYGQKKDVYILTSRDTFSAAEDFSYALQNLKRATVIGQTTGGGANAGEDVPLMPKFSAFVPQSRLISPITKTNWEGVGVKPDIAVCAADALKTAQVAILQKWAALEPDGARRQELQSRIADLGTQKDDGAVCQ